MIALAYWMKENFGGTMNDALRTVLSVKKSVKPMEKSWISLAVDDSTAEELLKKGYKVYNLDLKESVNKNVETIICDVTKEQQVIKAKEGKKEKKSFNKKNKELNEKKLKERDLLINEINKQENVRTEYPNTYKYSARNSEGHDVTGYLVAFTKQDHTYHTPDDTGGHQQRNGGKGLQRHFLRA